MSGYTLAIDIGGSKYMVGLADSSGKIIDSMRGEWVLLTASGVMDSIIASGKELLNSHPDITPEVIGATIPGLADPLNGIWVEACFSGVGDIPVSRRLTEAFGVPAYIDNDGQACALAEKLYGSCMDVEDFIYLTVSNGCGGGIFVNNKLCYGSSGNAGELGHVTVSDGGRQCNCGARGCLEMYAAGPAIVKNYLELGGSPQIEGRPADARLIADLARGGDRIALETYRLEGFYIGKALAAACNILNPRKIIIGGGVSLAFDLFVESLWEKLRDSIYKNANKELSIEASPFGLSGGLMGAVAVARCGLHGLYNWGNLT